MNVHDVEALRRARLEDLADVVERHARRARERDADFGVDALHHLVRRLQGLRVEDGVGPLEEAVQVRLVPDLHHGQTAPVVRDDRPNVGLVLLQIRRRQPPLVSVEDRQQLHPARVERVQQTVVVREVVGAVRLQNGRGVEVAADVPDARHLHRVERALQPMRTALAARHVGADAIGIDTRGDRRRRKNGRDRGQNE